MNKQYGIITYMNQLFKWIYGFLKSMENWNLFNTCKNILGIQLYSKEYN